MALNTVFGIRNLPNKIKEVTQSRKLILEPMESRLMHKDLKERHSNWPQITWSVNPSNAPHCLGGAESMVKAKKRSLRYFPTSSLTLLEFDAAIKNITCSINNSPLGWSVHSKPVTSWKEFWSSRACVGSQHHSVAAPCEVNSLLLVHKVEHCGFTSIV